MLFFLVKLDVFRETCHITLWVEDNILFESSYEPGVALHAVDFVIYENHSSTLSPTIRVQWEN